MLAARVTLRLRASLAAANSCAAVASEAIRRLAPLVPARSMARLAPADDYISWCTRTPVKLKLEEKAPGNYAPFLVQEMMRRTAQRHPEHIAMRIKRGGEWRTWTYAKYAAEVEAVGRAFLRLGLERFGGVGIMAYNGPEWFESSLGAIFAGGLSIGIYTTSSAEIVQYIGGHAPLNILVVQNAEFLEKATGGRPIKEALPTLKKVVCIDGDVHNNDMVMSWEELMALGAEGDGDADTLLAECEANQAANETCMLIYTSGTTGPPKGAMLSHDNITWTTRVAMEHHELEDAKEHMLSYLPLSHVAAQLIDCYMMMYVASTTHFADKDALKGTLGENLKEIRPTLFVGVPRVWEKMAERIQEVAKQNGFLKRQIAAWAKKQATRHHEARRHDRDFPASLGYRVAKKVVFDPLHQALGLERAIAREDGCTATAAPLSPATFRYFQSLDLIIQVFFGSTEASGPQSTNTPRDGMRVGSVGRCYTGVNNRILDPDPTTGKGEIVTRSRNIFMGYHKNEENTRGAFTDDYWFRSGDIGRFDEDGFLFLYGRIKELIITGGGKNIAPVPIEDAIKKELRDVISYAIVVGEGKNYLTCILTPKVIVDQETMVPTEDLEPCVTKWAAAIGCDNVKTVADVYSGPHSARIREEIQRGIDRVNDRAGSNPEKVQKFTLLPREFSVPGGELGPTLKIKRYHIYDTYSSEIDAMYKD